MISTKHIKRMKYEEAITYLNEHHIVSMEEPPKTYKYGDDISKLTERIMISQIGEAMCVD